MKCIACHNPLFSLPMHKHHQVWQQQPNYKPFSSSIQLGFIKGEGARGVIRARALPSSPVVLAVAANLTDSTKILVILQTGALCLFAFWVANFVVPGVVLKNLQSDDEDGEFSDSEE